MDDVAFKGRERRDRPSSIHGMRERERERERGDVGWREGTS
jgi:hypothetical protein